MKRSKSSSRWLQEHASDPYVKRAHREGWRSRAVFKLEQIQRACAATTSGVQICGSNGNTGIVVGLTAAALF